MVMMVKITRQETAAETDRNKRSDEVDANGRKRERRERDRQTDRQTDIQTDRLSETDRDRQTDKEIVSLCVCLPQPLSFKTPSYHIVSENYKEAFPAVQV